MNCLKIIISFQKQGKGYKQIAKALTVLRYTAGNIVHKFTFKGTMATLPGRGRKRKLSASATRFLRRQVFKNPQVTAKHLQQDLVVAGTEVSVCTVRRIRNTEGLHSQTPRCTPLLTQKHKESQLPYAQNHLNMPQKFWNSVLWRHETKLVLFGPMYQCYVWRKNVEKNTLIQ